MNLHRFVYTHLYSHIFIFRNSFKNTRSWHRIHFLLSISISNVQNSYERQNQTNVSKLNPRYQSPIQNRVHHSLSTSMIHIHCHVIIESCIAMKRNEDELCNNIFHGVAPIFEASDVRKTYRIGALANNRYRLLFLLCMLLLLL